MLHAGPISLPCEQLEVGASGFHQWKQRKASKEPSKAGRRSMSNDALLAHIKAIHAEVKGEYLHYVLERIADHPSNRLEELLPWVLRERLAPTWHDQETLRHFGRVAA